MGTPRADRITLEHLTEVEVLLRDAVEHLRLARNRLDNLADSNEVAGIMNKVYPVMGALDSLISELEVEP